MCACVLVSGSRGSSDVRIWFQRSELWRYRKSPLKKSLTLWQNERRILHLALSNVQVYLINAYLKEEFTSKWKFRHHLLTLEWFQTRMSFSPLLNTKEDTVFWRMSVTRLLMDPIDFHSRKTKYYDLLWYFIYISSTVWLLKFFRTSSFVSSIFHFEVNYSLYNWFPYLTFQKTCNSIQMYCD